MLLVALIEYLSLIYQCLIVNFQKKKVSNAVTQSDTKLIMSSQEYTGL